AGERGPGRAGADHNEINRKLIHALVVPLPNWTRAAPVRRLAQEARSRPPPSADGCPLARSAPQRVPARPAWVPASAIGAMAAERPRRMACHGCRGRHSLEEALAVERGSPPDAGRDVRDFSLHPVPMPQRRVLLWMCVLVAVNQLGFGAMVPSLPLYAQSFAVPASAIGLAGAAHGLAPV